MKVYAFVLSLIVMAGCTASRYQTPIQALADQGSPMQGANSSTLSALHILQAEDTANGKLLLYFLSDAKTEMAVTRVDRRKEDSWQAVASDQQYISDRSGTTSDDPNSISAFSSVLGQSPTYSVVYGFNRIGDPLNKASTFHVTWEDGFVTCKSVDFGGFLLFRAGNHVLDKIEINHEGCSTSTQQTDETAEIAPCIGSTINWVNYIKLNDIQYAGASPGQGYSIEPEMLGEEIAQVEFMVNCHADIGYKSKNGDAAYLPIGTPIYALKTYAPSFRIAARQDGLLTLFEAGNNPHAQVGADLLDIEGKVTLITVSTGTIHPTTISDPEQIQRIVTLFSEAPADQKIRSRPSLADRYVIEFHMADGLNVTSTYWPVLGRTALGIYPPDELATIIEEQK